MANKHTLNDLYQMQSLPLEAKIRMTKARVDGWVREYGEDGVYISFSGGKDSTVLVDIVRNVCGYWNIPLVFVDVPTQYPELRQFAETFDGLEIIRPRISFAEVCAKYGFPLISKEVSECVYGARKYLTQILNEENALASKQASKQARPKYRYYYEKVTGTGEYDKFSESPSNAEVIENAHLESIRGGTDTITNTKQSEYLELKALQKPTRGGVR